VATTCSVIGYGRFGAFWAQILTKEFAVKVYDPDPTKQAQIVRDGLEPASLESALESETIFYAVPISKFSETIQEHVKYFGNNPKLLIDLLSVKVHPKLVFDKFLPKIHQAMLCHPLFGPDSVRAAGLADQPIVLDQFRATPEQFRMWTSFFSGLDLNVIQMSGEEHDRLAAKSQGLAHFIGRILGEMQIEPTKIDTVGAKALCNLKDQVCNDTWELFSDLQGYNPYTLAMRVELGKAQAKVFNRLIPNRLNLEKLVIGIQGGPGSFNEQAVRHYLERAEISKYEVRYLYTTEGVFQALHCGDVDRGQFAIHNSRGGVVNESIEAMARFNFEIVEEYEIKISHALMIRSDATLNEIDTIMTHPQVLKQCAAKLSKKYSKLKLTSGQGDLIDHAQVAQHLAQRHLPKNIATMGSSILAELNDLIVVEDNLQDLEDNFTSFMMVQRPS
jgi:arogenate dehydrogenase (NADP+)